MALVEAVSHEQHTPFRFLDLPAEMRNSIYASLLTPSKQAGTWCLRLTCYPQILAVCKQIYEEASDILHETACIPLTLELASHYVDDLPEDEQPKSTVRLCFNNEKIFTGKQGDLDTPIPFPSCVPKLSSIDLELCLAAATRPADMPEYEDGLVQMNRAVHDLTVLLSKSETLRNLTIFAAGSPLISASQAFRYDVVSPISVLCTGTRKITYDEDLDNMRAPGMLPFTQWIRDAAATLNKIRATGDNALYQLALIPEKIPHGHIYSRDGLDEVDPAADYFLKFRNAQELLDLLGSKENQEVELSE